MKKTRLLPYNIVFAYTYLTYLSQLFEVINLKTYSTYMQCSQLPD